MIKAEFSPDGVYLRHSEGAFLRLPDGGIVFIYSRFYEQSHDDAPSNLVRTVSYDEGESWSAPETVISADMYGARNVMSVSLLEMQNGDLGCFYILKNAPDDNIIMLSRSKDGGRSFYRHLRCSLADRPGIYVLNNDRALRLSSGRLILPLTFHRAAYTPGVRMYFDGRGSACCLISDDDGESWREAADVVYPPFTGSDSGLQENGAVELKNGALYGFSRTDMGCHYSYLSVDAGEHWSSAQPTRFSAPLSPLCIKRNHYTGELFAVWNPAPNYRGRRLYGCSQGRTPLVFAVSRDEGASWGQTRVIEDDEARGYCYTALFFTRDGCLLAAYCAGGPEDGGCLCRLRINKLELT